MNPALDYCAIPIQPPPSDQTSNLIDPVDLATQTLALGPVLTVLSLAFLSGRFFLNWVKLTAADYLAFAGFILSTSYTGVVIALRNFSRHAWDVPACWYLSSSAWQLLFASNLLLGPTQFVVKVAILVLYLQLFAVYQRTRWAIVAAIVFAGLIYLPHPILVIVFEAPRSGESWIDTSTDGNAYKLNYYAPIHGIGSIILDIWILILPIPALNKLHVPRRKKFQLFAVFLTGFLGVISSIFSCFWRFHLVLDNPGDKTWQEGQLFLWIMTEHNVALIVGSMPAFAGFVKTHIAGSLQSLRSRIFGGESSRGDGSGSSSVPKLSKPNSSSHATDQRSGPGSRAYYYELTDTIPNTQTSVTAVGSPQNKSASPDEEQGILSTTYVSQESYRRSAE